MLVSLGVIMSECNSIEVKERTDCVSTKKRNSKRKVTERVPNKDILPTDFSVEELRDFQELMDDSISFLLSIYSSWF
jgi:hypothetical protein